MMENTITIRLLDDVFIPPDDYVTIEIEGETACLIVMFNNDSRDAVIDMSDVGFPSLLDGINV